MTVQSEFCPPEEVMCPQQAGHDLQWSHVKEQTSVSQPRHLNRGRDARVPSSGARQSRPRALIRLCAPPGVRAGTAGALRLCARTGSVQGHCFRSPGGLDGACSSCPPVSDGYSDTEGCSRLGAPLIHQTVPRPAPACPRNSPRICTSTSDRP